MHSPVRVAHPAARQRYEALLSMEIRDCRIEPNTLPFDRHVIREWRWRLKAEAAPFVRSI